MFAWFAICKELDYAIRTGAYGVKDTENLIERKLDQISKPSKECS